MSTKHTPGPWLISDDDLKQDPEAVFSIGIWSGSADFDAPESVMVAHVSAFGLHSEMRDGCEYVTPDEPEQREIDTAIANARLIAAAPEMLKALQEALPDLHGVWLLNAKEAIAKATGSTS